MAFEHNPDFPIPTDVIPHRPPRLWLSGVTEFEADKGGRGFWIPTDENFEGHFPDMPILQGVQQLESLAQLGCYVAMLSQRQKGEESEKGVLFVDDFTKYTAPVFPGETLELSIEMAGGEKGQFMGKGKVAVNGEVTLESTITGAIMEKERLDKLLALVKRRRSR